MAPCNQLHVAMIEPADQPVAVELDLVQPLIALRHMRLERRQLHINGTRQWGLRRPLGRSPRLGRPLASRPRPAVALLRRDFLCGRFLALLYDALYLLASRLRPAVV